MQFYGWIYWPGEVQRIVSTLKYPTIDEVYFGIKDSGKGKVVLLYEAARRVMNRDLDTGPQQIGDCVGWGFAGAIDLLACVEVMEGNPEMFSWELRTSTEWVYGSSRVEYGNLDGSYSDGSVGAWAAKAVNVGGIISRQVIGEYDPKRAKEWGAKGVPDDLEPEAKKHRVMSVTLVTSYEQARDLIANGYPIVVCSDQGFVTKRDTKGFCKPRGTWMHCMKFIAVKDDDQPALLCMNSWGNDSPTGPKGDYDIPDGSFWVDAEVCNRMLRQRDSFALSAFDGYPTRRLDWLI